MSQAAPHPRNEAERLAVLRRLNILDTEAERHFDEIVAFASRLCEVPISLISLVDADRQWFKARVGLDADTTPRDIGFCAHTILRDEAMVVEDAREDQRFADSPMVTGFPNIVFYAGVPLAIEDDVNVGSLCIVDHVPRRLSDEQMQGLRVLADAAVAHMRLHRLESEWPGIGKRVALCAWCRSVRTEVDGVGTWKPLHEYVSAIESVSHGMCPTCAEQVSNGKPSP